jgi:hypothetical protein
MVDMAVDMNRPLNDQLATIKHLMGQNFADGIIK